MKAISKSFVALFLIVTCITYFNPLVAKAIENINAISEVDFMQKVEGHSLYTHYQEIMISDEPLLVTETTGVSGNHTGYLAQYEIEMINEEKVDVGKSSDELALETSVTSLITFVYDYEKDKMDVILIDYSKIDSTQDIYVKDLISNKEEVISVSETENEELAAVAGEIKLNKEEMIEEAALEIEKNGELSIDESVQPNAIHCNWWQCTKYETGGGELVGGACTTLVGAACSIILHKLERLGKAICAAGTLISCYVPKYRVCISGYWETRMCPIAS